MRQGIDLIQQARPMLHRLVNEPESSKHGFGPGAVGPDTDCSKRKQRRNADAERTLEDMSAGLYRTRLGLMLVAGRKEKENEAVVCCEREESGSDETTGDYAENRTLGCHTPPRTCRGKRPNR